jgi:hypothetical protein
VNGERNRSFGKGSGTGKMKRKEGGWHEKGKGKRERIMDVMISSKKLVDISG